MDKQHGNPNGLKEKLRTGEPSYVFAVRSIRDTGIVNIALAAQYDAVYIDFQHSPIALHEAANVFHAGAHGGLTVLARVPAADVSLVARCIDAGAHGLMLADLRDAEQARRCVEAALLHPIGNRSFGMPVDPRFMGMSGAVLMQAINQATLLVAMIESEQAVDGAEAIAAIDGIDAVQIGTADLSASMGVPGDYGHPRVQSAYRKVALACNAVKKPLIIGGIRNPAYLQPYIALGAVRCYFVGSDTGFLLDAARQAKSRLQSDIPH
ncbi:HpcH/HpaI aldolase family protein [Hydrogenophaga sp. OTU3427]|uniref:HpcH/HpaI aldolase family protein n=1 Tax=Hydrogenophaga sp. OTU3427 TaxID=3043856 RepID=UPI00313B69D1